MTFEAILPELKKGAKIIRKGWGGYEEYVKYIPETTIEGVTMTPYFVIMVKDTVCFNRQYATFWQRTG